MLRAVTGNVAVRTVTVARFDDDLLVVPDH
jgi:hypothetical protein